MKKIWQLPLVWQYVVVFLGLIACYLAFALVANLLPNKPIRKNIVRTVEQADLADDFGFVLQCRPAYYMDNFTDALILNQAYHGGSDHLLTSMLLVPRRDTQQSLCGSLREIANGNPPPDVHYYARYWHGSTFLMRVLLLFGSYVSLRLFLYVVSSLLLLWLLVAVARQVGLWASVLYLLSLLLVNVFVMQFSIQFVPVLLIACGTSLWVLNRAATPGQFCMTMFVAGSLTTYFDLLTCPMLTWGMPMCTYLLMNAFAQPSQPLRQRMRVWSLSSFLWALSYGATWVSKWIIATLFTGENVIQNGMAQFAERAGEGGEITRLAALTRNVALVNWQLAVVIVVLLLALVVFRFRRGSLQNSLLSLITAVPPCLWYMATANHSYLHYWFTFRSMAVVVLALFFALALMVDWSRVGTQKHAKL